MIIQDEQTWSTQYGFKYYFQDPKDNWGHFEWIFGVFWYVELFHLGPGAYLLDPHLVSHCIDSRSLSRPPLNPLIQ